MCKFPVKCVIHLILNTKICIHSDNISSAGNVVFELSKYKTIFTFIVHVSKHRVKKKETFIYNDKDMWKGIVDMVVNL